MKYYEDDYDDGEYPLKDETVRRPEIQLENLRGLDWLLALVLSLVSGGLLTLWAFPGLSPDAWNDAAIGAGLRPMEAIFPGFWNALMRGLYSIAGISTGTFLLKILGRVIAGLSVGLVYLLLRQILSITIRVRLQFSGRRFLVVRGVAVLGALFFACSDPVWRAGQAFTSPLLLLFLTVLVLTLFFSFLMSGGMKQIYLSMFFLGLLSAETPMGFFILALVWGVYLLALRHGAVAADSPILNPIVEQSSKWHLTFLYAIGLVIGVAINCSTFIAFDGLAVFDVTGGDMPVMYASQWWSQFIGAASGLGWVLALGIGVLPFIVSAVLLPRAVDEEQFLPYHTGAVFFVTGAFAFAQLAALRPLWFWTWTNNVVKSPYFLLVLMLFSAAAVVFSLAVMAVDICCRDHRRLAMQRFAELKEEEESGSEEVTDVKQLGIGAYIVLALVPVLLLAAVVPGRYQGKTRQMLALMNDYVQEVLNECGDARWIFSEGRYDPILELESASRSASQGPSLLALGMIGGKTPREQYIRLRGVDAEDTESRYVLAQGAPMALHTWATARPDMLAQSAVQLGFEVWKQRMRKRLPPCSGVLMRPIGMSEEDRVRGVDAAYALAQRIISLYDEEGGPSKNAGRNINSLFRIMQWRIARLARMRAEHGGLAKEDALSKDLDAKNTALQDLRRDLDRAEALATQSVTPRRGLKLALESANFPLAQQFAVTILPKDPDDPDANFAMGMSYYTQQEWVRAEEFLRRCLIRRPKEPAALNNLAMICLRTERYDEGLVLAQKALEYLPESDGVKDTIKQLQEARGDVPANPEKGQEPDKPTAEPPPPAVTDAPPSVQAAAAKEKPENPKAGNKPDGKATEKKPGGKATEKKPGGKAAEKKPGGKAVEKKPGGKKGEKKPVNKKGENPENKKAPKKKAEKPKPPAPAPVEAAPAQAESEDGEPSMSDAPESM